MRPAGRARPRCGIEHEFEVHHTGRPVDFETVMAHLALVGTRLDPTDAYAVRGPWGGVITVDQPQAEIATPPVHLRPGSTRQLVAWTRLGRHELDTALAELDPGFETHGYSTHVNVEVDDRHVVDVGYDVATRFAPLLVALLCTPDTPGVLVRPRRGRLEFGGEFIDGSELGLATLVLAAITDHVVEAIDDSSSRRLLPPNDEIPLEGGRQRFGWYVNRESVAEVGPSRSDSWATWHRAVGPQLEQVSMRLRGRIDDVERLLVDALADGVEPPLLHRADDPPPDGSEWRSVEPSSVELVNPPPVIADGTTRLTAVLHSWDVIVYDVEEVDDDGDATSRSSLTVPHTRWAEIGAAAATVGGIAALLATAPRRSRLDVSSLDQFAVFDTREGVTGLVPAERALRTGKISRRATSFATSRRRMKRDREVAQQRPIEPHRPSRVRRTAQRRPMIAAGAAIAVLAGLAAATFALTRNNANSDGSGTASPTTALATIPPESRAVIPAIPATSATSTTSTSTTSTIAATTTLAPPSRPSGIIDLTLTSVVVGEAPDLAPAPPAGSRQQLRVELVGDCTEVGDDGLCILTFPDGTQPLLELLGEWASTALVNRVPARVVLSGSTGRWSWTFDELGACTYPDGASLVLGPIRLEIGATLVESTFRGSLVIDAERLVTTAVSGNTDLTCAGIDAVVEFAGTVE